MGERRRFIAQASQRGTIRFQVLTSIMAFAAIAGAVIAWAPRTAAFQATPASTMETMTVDASRSTIESYLNALLTGGDFAQYLADDVVLMVMDIGQEVEGKQAVVDTIVALHTQVFEAKPELTGLVVDEGRAAAELVFAGTHTEEFAAIAPSGREVRVPYAAVYDLANGQITAIRLFGFASGLIVQLTAEATPVP